MADKFFPVSFEQWEREEGEIGYDFIKRYPKQLRTCSYEFGSVDFALISYSRFCYKDIVYESVGQYLVINGSGSTDRIIVGRPVYLVKENAAILEGGIIVIPPDEVTIQYLISGDGLLQGLGHQVIEKGTDGSKVKVIEGEHGIFKQWSDGLLTPERQELKVEENFTVTAEFLKACILQYMTEQGAILGDSKQKVEYGKTGNSVIVQKLIEDTFWKFREWSDGFKDNIRTDIASEDLAVTAQYDPYSAFSYSVYPQGLAAGESNAYYGRIEVSGERFFNKEFQCVIGDSITAKAIPNKGYAFNYWNNGLKIAERTDVATEQEYRNFYAYFIKVFTFQYLTERAGTLIGDTHQIVRKGSNGTEVTANDDGWFVFKQWSDGILAESRTDLNAQNDITVTAEYAETGLRGYRAGNGGSLEGWDYGPTSLKLMFEGESTTVSAVADDGYRFKQWDDGILLARRTDPVILSDVSEFAAEFIKTWTLRYLVDSEKATLVGEATQIVDDGESGSDVRLSTKDLWRFLKWSDGSEATTRKDTNISKDLTVSALFDLAAHVTLQHGEHGQFKDANTYSYSFVHLPLGVPMSYGGIESSYVVIPDSGYRFKCWSDGSTDNPPHFTPTEQKKYVLVAEYEENYYIIEIIYDETKGSVQGKSYQRIKAGEKTSYVSVYGKDGYAFYKWSSYSEAVDDVTQNTIFSYIPTKSLTLNASFGKVLIVPCSVYMEKKYTSSTPDGSYYMCNVVLNLTIPDEYRIHASDGYIISTDTRATGTIYSSITFDDIGEIPYGDRRRTLYSYSQRENKLNDTQQTTLRFTIRSNTANDPIKITHINLAVVCPPD